MKKVLSLTILSLVISLITVSKGFCGWPISHTPAIEGVVTDSTTGKPIENAVIKCTWLKRYIFSLDASTGGIIGSQYVITNKDGKYTIPSKYIWYFGSMFDGIEIVVLHPLYASYTNSGVLLPKTNYLKNLKKYFKDGIIEYNISMLSLSDYYKLVDSQKIAHEYSTYSESHGEYFKIALIKGLGKGILTNYLEEKETIFLDCYSKDKDFNIRRNYFNEYKEEILNIINRGMISDKIR